MTRTHSYTPTKRILRRTTIKNDITAREDKEKKRINKAIKRGGFSFFLFCSPFASSAGDDYFFSSVYYIY